MFLNSPSARVAELADALDLGSSGVTRRGSTPLSRTTLHFSSTRHSPTYFLLSSCILLLPFPYRQNEKRLRGIEYEYDYEQSQNSENTLPKIPPHLPLLKGGIIPLFGKEGRGEIF